MVLELVPPSIPALKDYGVGEYRSREQLQMVKR
jgi:hypothetical protein